MEAISPILTRQERDILIFTSLHPGGKHLTNKEIGQRLGISVTQVKSLMHQACTKLEARNRNHAVLLALRMGEINLNELLSLEELAQILNSVDPEVLRKIANLVRHNRFQRTMPDWDEQIVCRERRQPGKLTNRERDVLSLVSYGFTNTEIAEKLCMSESAVRTFLNRAFTKLGARKRADALQLALKQREICVAEISSFDELTYYLVPYGAEAIEKMAQILDEKHRSELS